MSKVWITVVVLAVLAVAVGFWAMRPTTETSTSPAPTTEVSGKTVYHCPMHPEVTSTDPNATCKKCGGMKLVPKK